MNGLMTSALERLKGMKRGVMLQRKQGRVARNIRSSEEGSNDEESGGIRNARTKFYSETTWIKQGSKQDCNAVKEI